MAAEVLGGRLRYTRLSHVGGLRCRLRHFKATRAHGGVLRRFRHLLRQILGAVLERTVCVTRIQPQPRGIARHEVKGAHHRRACGTVALYLLKVFGVHEITERLSVDVAGIDTAPFKLIQDELSGFILVRAVGHGEASGCVGYRLDPRQATHGAARRNGRHDVRQHGASGGARQEDRVSKHVALEEFTRSSGKAAQAGLPFGRFRHVHGRRGQGRSWWPRIFRPEFLSALNDKSHRPESKGAQGGRSSR